jgi:hypothetical protein
MINTSLCNICKRITLEDIASQHGITLPLEPYIRRWESPLYSQTDCGLCALLRHSLRSTLRPSMETLIFNYHQQYEAILVVAVSKLYLKESSGIEIQFLCGTGGESWYHEIIQQGRLACAFLAVKLGVGMSDMTPRSEIAKTDLSTTRGKCYSHNHTSSASR